MRSHSIRSSLAALTLGALVLAAAPRRASACAQDAASSPAATSSADSESPDAAKMLRLRDGSIRWGSIQSHDPDGIVFQSLETGGRAHLPWSYLHPEEERELRERFGYVDLSGEEVLIDADRIVTIEGQEIIGLIIDRSSDSLMVKTASATIRVPKNRILGAPTIVRVPATEVFTRAELYNQQLANTDVSTAAGNFQLAQYCEQVNDFAHAVDHYKAAQSIDASFQPDNVKLGLARATEKAARQDQVDYLTEVEGLAARHRFDEAFARAEAFKDKYPDSPLLPQAKKTKDRVVKAREKYTADRVATLWFLRVGQLAHQAGGKMGYEEAVNYLGGQMQKDVIDYVVKEGTKLTKEATPDAVKKWWGQRRKIRWNRASYGLGTWLLGKDAALKGSEDPNKKDDKKPLSETDKNRQDLEKKLQRYLENQELARKAKTTGEQKDDREAAWKELPVDARRGWILAYYVENSGDFEVDKKPMLAACRECGGEGTRIVALAGANVSRQAIGKQSTETRIECPSCHGLGIVRRISYK
jgi:hypothetical protein